MNHFCNYLIVKQDLSEDTELSNVVLESAQVFVLVDSHTRKHCLPILLKHLPCERAPYIIEIPAGEDYKNLDTCKTIWVTLSHHKADRKSLLLNLGGGMVCDIGAFAASTYMRGIAFINIPTSLLAMIDASVGGKCGVNLGNFKNQVGLFSPPIKTIIYKDFLNTLPDREIICGYAEMLKHALISSNKLWQLITPYNFSSVKEQMSAAIKVKEDIVTSDPLENGQRKCLNLGHTTAHALEMLYGHDNSIKHGEAVAIGLIIASHISKVKGFLQHNRYNEITSQLKAVFPFHSILNQDYEELFEIMLHDKKNTANEVKMVLINDFGTITYDVPISKEIIFKAFDAYNQLYA